MKLRLCQNVFHILLCTRLQRRIFNCIAAVQDVSREQFGADQVTGCFERLQQLAHRVFVIAARLIRLLGTACRSSQDEFFAVKRSSCGAVCPAVSQHGILPFFQKRRRAVPVEWELEDDAIVFQAQRLLSFDVDHFIRVFLVQIVHRDFRMFLQFLNPTFVNSRFFQIGMCDDDQYFHNDTSLSDRISLKKSLACTYKRYHIFVCTSKYQVIFPIALRPNESEP